MRVRFIINPMAGGGVDEDAVTESISDALHGFEGIFEVKVSRFKGDGAELATQAVKKNYDAVFAMGGDGTINEIGAALLHSDTALGILPAGSGNGLARSMGIPLKPIDALEVLRKGHVRTIDAGTMNGRPFFSTAGLGFDAFLSGRYAEWAKKHSMRGVLPYYFLSIKEYRNFKPQQITIKADGETITAAPFILTVANTREFGGSAVIAPKAAVDDGFLDVCMIEGVGFLGAVFSGVRMLTGTIDNSGKYRCIKAKEIEIERSEPGFAHIDGESFMAKEKFTFKALPKALKIWAFK